MLGGRSSPHSPRTPGSHRVNWQLFTLELDDLNTLTNFPVLYFYSYIFSFSFSFCVPPELCEAFHPFTLEQAWAFLVPGWCEVYEILIGSYIYHIKHCQRHNGPMLCHICAVLNVFLASIQTSMLQIHQAHTGQWAVFYYDECCVVQLYLNFIWDCICYLAIWDCICYLAIWDCTYTWFEIGYPGQFAVLWQEKEGFSVPRSSQEEMLKTCSGCRSNY